MTNLTCPSVDINLLNTNSFQLVIERLPNVSFFVTEAEVPSLELVSLNEATTLTSLKIPSDKITFSDLSVVFKVDSRMDNYIELFKWIQGLGHPESHSQYTIENNTRSANLTELDKNYSDGKLMVLGPSNEVIRTFNFVDLFPTSIGSIRFSSTNTDVEYATCQVSFSYTYYNIT